MVLQTRTDISESAYVCMFQCSKHIVSFQEREHLECDQIIISVNVWDSNARLCRAMGGAEKVEIEHGNHSLSNRVDEAVKAIIDFVKREGPKGWDDPWN